MATTLYCVSLGLALVRVYAEILRTICGLVWWISASSQTWTWVLNLYKTQFWGHLRRSVLGQRCVCQSQGCSLYWASDVRGAWIERLVEQSPIWWWKVSRVLKLGEKLSLIFVFILPWWWRYVAGIDLNVAWLTVYSIPIDLRPNWTKMYRDEFKFGIYI